MFVFMRGDIDSSKSEPKKRGCKEFPSSRGTLR